MEEKHKICKNCNVHKPLHMYYRHVRMKDGHLNKCIECTKKDTKEQTDILKQDPEWVERERKRHRDKYYRLSYKDLHKPSAERKKEIMKAYTDRYPEKMMAASAVGSVKIKEKGNERHHWSYNQEHWKDILELSRADHNKAHRFMIYDQERKMYRKTSDNELLDTKEKHLEWINWCLANKE